MRNKLVYILAGSNLLTIIIFCYFYFGDGDSGFCRHQKPNYAKGTTVSVGKKGPVACPPSCYQDPDCTVELHKLNTNLATAMIKNYMNNHWSVLNDNCPTVMNKTPVPSDRTPFVDSRCAWFDLDTLKKFIYEIESKTCNNRANATKPCDTNLKLGIRIYFAEYPSAADWTSYQGLETVPQEYAGLHTLLMVPTFYNGTNDVDFDPSVPYVFDAACQEPPMFDTLALNSLILGPTNQSAFRNHGGLIPPPFKPTGPPLENFYKFGNRFMEYSDTQ